MLRIRELEPADADFLGAMLYEAIYWDPAKERLPAEFVLAHSAVTIFHDDCACAHRASDRSAADRNIFMCVDLTMSLVPGAIISCALREGRLCTPIQPFQYYIHLLARIQSRQRSSHRSGEVGFTNPKP